MADDRIDVLFWRGVRELISAFAEATEAIIASDPRSRARVLGKRATDMLNGSRRHSLREANARNASPRRRSACARARRVARGDARTIRDLC